MLEGLEVDGKVLGFCVCCHQGKMCQHSFGKKWSIPEDNFAEIHVDLMGPFPRSTSHYRFCLSVICIRSKFVWVFFLKRKSDASLALTNFIAMVETQFKKKILKWHDDKGGEFVSNDWLAMLKTLGIKRTKTDTQIPPKATRSSSAPKGP